MKTIHLLILGILSLFCLSCGTVVKKLSGFKDPKVENKKSVNDFTAKNELDIQNNYFLAINSVSDKDEIQANFLFSVSLDMLIFDDQGNRYCYNGTQECSGVQLQEMASEFKNKYKICEKDEIEEYFSYSDLNTFLDKLTDSSGNKVTKDNLPKADFYIFELWNKYSKKKKHIKEDFQFTKDIAQKSDIDFAIIYVNTDLLEEWGLEKGKKVKTKFKYNKGRSFSINFGDLPFKE